MLRLGRRPDVILLTENAIFVLEIKANRTKHTLADRRQVDDYAIDLRDFHEGSRENPIIPILIAEQAPQRFTHQQFIFDRNVALPLDANPQTLPLLLRDLNKQAAHVACRLDADAWLAARYQPVPTIVDAACMLYAKHNVADIHSARSDTVNLRATTEAILSEIEQARVDGKHLILFVTGIPGAGKTLCGLDTIFGTEDGGRGTYLTGNPTLIHVLREALTRDAVEFGANRGDASRKMLAAIQALPKFRDHYVANPTHAPAEQIVVVDEAQRCWSAAWAVAKTRDKAVPLTRSEPAHLLEAMARHDGFSAVVCLVGGGQEIHSGEGGLAEWGDALRQAEAEGIVWRKRAPPDLLGTIDPRQRLGALADLQSIAALHLNVSVRQIRSHAAAEWVDLVLIGDAEAARAVVEETGEVPFLLTRDLAAMRGRLRANARGLRRAGLLASSGAARLRAEGLGVELPHMDASAVAHWFLDRFPEDVRASDALEVVATEFSCQGLELDFVGLCWDADLIREAGRTSWRVRTFRGTDWQMPRQPEAIANQINTYRVLLTRARYETVIFLPPGDDGDRTRKCSIYDGIADFLVACGVRHLEACPVQQCEPETEALLI
ncbi:DNA/RNA helicase domain-containing protein [Acidisphaera sp. S103]|uniref:DNA/RNA helicase domain-containing protein n=1 Tax=Acidisphaera sp. S103 TaxID=1747223 RepID=UPI0020B13D46|nr:DNA/RNA helicase domain-containing protein [Acidisphaera sp. S103]